MAILIDPERTKVLRAAPRLMQILRVLARHKFLGALFGRGHWPSPKEVRETFEELGLVFLKLGQVLALRRDLLLRAYIDELLLLHDQLPAMDIDVVRATVERELGAPLTKMHQAIRGAYSDVSPMEIWAGFRVWRPWDVASAAISSGSRVPSPSRLW